MVDELLAGEEAGRDLLTLLKLAQRRYGYLSPEVLVEVSRALDMPLGEVYGVTTFYSFLHREPPGRNVIRVCNCVPCLLKGSLSIMDALERELRIKAGATAPDGRFTLQRTNCFGACDQAPAMMINGERYGHLSPERIREILAKYQ